MKNNKILTDKEPIVLWEGKNLDVVWDNGYPLGGNYWSNCARSWVRKGRKKAAPLKPLNPTVKTGTEILPKAIQTAYAMTSCLTGLVR